MLSCKVKARPAPLHLNPIDVKPEVQVPISTGEPNKYAENEGSELQQELSRHFESTLIKLLQDDELMPFNLHTAASLGMTSNVRYLIER